MAPKAGQLIRITAVRAHTTRNLKVGSIMIVGEDEHPPGWKDPDGYEWVQSPDHPSEGSGCGWVKWEGVKIIGETEYELIIKALVDARVANDGERICDAITRLAGERDSERAAAQRLNQNWINERADGQRRIQRLEAEIMRLSSPPGTSYGFANGKPVPSQVKEIPLPAIGSWIKITETTSHALTVGEIIQVGACKRDSFVNDQVWVSSGKECPAYAPDRFGWVKWQEWSAPVAGQTPADRSLIGRQRRELRRLNQSQRLMKLELDHARRLVEDLAESGIVLKRQLRVLESV